MQVESLTGELFFQSLESLVTTPVRPPSDVRWQCLDDNSEHPSWTSAWNHMLDDHGGVSPNWVLLGTLPD